MAAMTFSPAETYPGMAWLRRDQAVRNAQVLPDGVTNIQRDKTQAPRSLRMLAGRWLRSPWTPVVIVLVCYTWWTLAFLHAGHDVHDFIHVGRNFAQQSTKSATINAAFGPDYHYDPIVGYDGQFCYFVALDPVNARYYIDRPAFRYARILYPMAARLLAFGQSALIPYTLLLINWLAVGGGTLLVALWLQRKGRPTWLAIFYGLYSGLFIAYGRDLTEPLSYGLVALAIYLFDFGGRRRLVWSGLAFAGALLARETTVVFAGLYGIAPLFAALATGDGANALRGWRDRLLASVRSGWRNAVLLLSVAFAPYLLYKLFLGLWLNDPGVRSDLSPQFIPFGGLLVYWPWPTLGWTIATLVIPALVCAVLGLLALRRQPFSVEVWALLANVLLFIVMLPPLDYVDYQGTSRITTGVVLAALLCVPAFDSLTAGRHRWWLSICGALWITVTIFLLATVTT